MLERGIGYWLTDEDQMLPVPPRVTHAEMARELFDPVTLSEADAETYQRDANAFALSRGWSRVRIYPADAVCYLDLGTGSRHHRGLLDDLLDRLGLVGYTIKFADEQGNYVS